MKRTIPKISGYTKVQVLSYVKMCIRHSAAWAKRACLVIYDQQTADEKRKHLAVSGSNGCGFSRYDAPLLSDIACRIRCHRETIEDIEILQSQMPKYAAQVICIAHRKDKCKKLKVFLDRYYNRKQPELPI